MRFSRELKQRRTKRKLSLREAAKEIGNISHSSLDRFERGLGLMEMAAEKAEALSIFYAWDLEDMVEKMHREAKRTRSKVCAR